LVWLFRQVEEDAEDRDRRLAAIQQAEAEARLKRRSQCIQRALPRPTNLDKVPGADGGEGGAGDTPESLLATEVLKMLQWDSVKYPLKEKKNADSKKEKQKRKRKEDRARLPFIPDDELQQARQLLEAECEQMRQQYGEIDPASCGASLQKARDSMAYVPSREGFALTSDLSTAERLEAMTHQVRECCVAIPKR
jgi:pre-mRNA-splicing factor CDC5/CEF1